MGTSKTILLLSDNPTEDYVARIHSGAKQAVASGGFALRSINLHNGSDTIGDVLDREECAGLIVTPPICDDRASLGLFERRGIPYVRIAPMLDVDRASSVGMDEFQAAADIVSVLTEAGHTRIAIMRGPKSQLVSMRRYNGYANAIGAKGLKVDHSLVVEGSFTRQSGRDEAGKLFAARPTAIFASNDEMAAGIIDAAKAAGVDLPGALSIVGFDDNAVASKVQPRLTTVRQPCEAMGQAAGRIIVDTIRSPARSNEHVLVPYDIVRRESVTPPL